VTGQSTGKPTVAELGIDPAAQVWRRSGNGDGALEVAFAHAADADPPDPADPAHHTDPAHRTTHRAEWVLMRVAGDPEQRVLVFDRHEWECFLDGARKGEFDDAAAGQ
jgi:uncharacterized protein DUF397